MDKNVDVALNEVVEEVIKDFYDSILPHFSEQNKKINKIAEHFKVSVAEVRNRIKKFEDKTSQPSLLSKDEALKFKKKLLTHR